MIKYNGVSEDGSHIYYGTYTDQRIPVLVKVYEGYTGGFIFNSEIDVDPGINYFTQIYPSWEGRKVMIYHRETGELLAPFVIPGNKKLSSLDQYGYIKRLFEIEKDPSCQAGILDVLREHLYDRQYENYVDVEEGDVVLDVGFNYGIFSLGALMKGASQIYGLEPNKEIYRIIRYVYPEKSKVKIYNFAASGTNETLNFLVGHNTLASSIVGQVDDFRESYEVKCVNLYDFIQFNQIGKIDFLKIDCEGTEYEIFECIPDDFFKTIRKIHVEFHFNDGQKILPLIDKLDRNGFEWKYEHDRDQYSSIGLIFAKNKNL
jgi:FkbM family methyltransferase